MHVPSALENRQHGIDLIAKYAGEPRNVQLRYRFGSPTSYVFAALRCPKLTVLSRVGNNVCASKQLERFRPMPSLELHTTRHPKGNGGNSDAVSGLGWGQGPVETLNVERYLSFHDGDELFDGGDESGVLSTFSGNVMVPSQWPGTRLDELDTGGASAAA